MTGISKKYEEDSLKCPVCGGYFRRTEGFTCTTCRRGPLCKDHRVVGQTECLSCATEKTVNKQRALKRQTGHLRSFLRFLQFIFIVLAMLFIALKIGLTDEVEFLKNSLVSENFIYASSACTVIVYLLFYGIMYNQRRKLSQIEARLNKLKRRRMV
jgi:membrane protein insertase Oxa1/YidC/SpoIIIJ